MRDVKKVLELRFNKVSQRNIASTLSLSRNTVSQIIKSADEKMLFWDKASNMSETEIQDVLFPRPEITLHLEKPDFEYIHKELLKPGTTIRLLWEEYSEQCKKSKIPYYRYSYFCEMYRNYVKRNNLTMHINHKPGDKMMVDWFGTTMSIFDSYTGEEIPVYLFEATLPFSMYCYVQACFTMKVNDWIDCHINAFKYFEGVSRLLIPDNLKTGVINHKKYEDPLLNKAYQEMSDHYGVTVIPTRVRKPKDKAAVEGSVGDCTVAIIGRLRNRKFFSIEDLNKAILKELNIFNTKPFQKKEGSRESVYLNEEKEFMKDLPEKDFELSEWKKAKVQLNYHISVDRMNYSVPYEYVGNYVDVRITKSTIRIYYKNNQICSHQRLNGRKNQYSTNEEHMPVNHQIYQWNKDRFIKWSLSIGSSTNELIEKLFERYKVEEQAYQGCLSILKLEDKYGKTRLEDACQLALEHISKPGYKNIKMILESNQDIKYKEDKKIRTRQSSLAFVRGADYYGGKNNG